MYTKEASLRLKFDIDSELRISPGSELQHLLARHKLE